MTAAYTLRPLHDVNASRWDSFVAKCPEATFFHRAAWRPLVERVFGHRTHYHYVERDREIVGVLPLIEVKSALFGHSLISNGFSICGGPAVTDDIARAILDQQAAELLKRSGAAYVEYRCPAVVNTAWQTRDNLYAGFSAPLAADEAENLKQIPRKQRAVVRKAIAAGLTYAIETDTRALYDLYAISVRNLGTPVFSRAYFAALADFFAADCDILTVSANGRPLASVLTFYHGDEVMPFYTGSRPEARQCGANDFMYWRLMRHAAARGCTTFNFGRSKIGTGPYEFKKNWGFTPHPLTHQFLMRPGAAQPDINPLNPKYRMMIALWKRLPVCVANIIGPPIVRNIA